MYKLTLTSYPNNEIRAVAYKLPSVKKETYNDTEPPLDITSKLETVDRERNPGTLKPGYGGTPRPTKFGNRGKRTLLRVGGVLDKICKPHQIEFMTGTIPGGTQKAFQAVASYSAAMVKRLKDWVNKHVPSKYDFYVWELQKRGALHLHYAVYCPDPRKQEYLRANFKAQWIRILDYVSNESGVDIWQRRDGRTWAENKDVVQAYSQPVEKSVTAYLAKYCGKSEGKGGQYRNATVHYPTRWWSVSRPLLRKLAEMTIRYEVIYNRASEALSMMDDIKTVLTSVTDKCYSYVHKLSGAITTVAYQTTFTIGGLCTMTLNTNNTTNSSKTSGKALSVTRCQLAYSMKAYGITQEEFYMWCGAFSRSSLEQLLASKSTNMSVVLEVLNGMAYILCFKFHARHPQYQSALEQSRRLEGYKRRLISIVQERPELRSIPMEEWD